MNFILLLLLFRSTFHETWFEVRTQFEQINSTEWRRIEHFAESTRYPALKTHHRSPTPAKQNNTFLDIAKKFFRKLNFKSSYN